MNKYIKKVSKISIALTLSFFLLVLLYFFHPIPLQGTNVDLGHHLLLGEITTKTLSVPQTNLISFTHPEYVFVNNQWLSEVVYYLIKSIFGFNGLIVLSVTLAVTSFLMLFVYLKKHLTIASVIGIFYLQMIMDRTEIKPELFSYLLLSIYIFVLYRFKDKPTKLIYLLPILMISWINFHIFFIVGLGLIGIFFIDSFVNKGKKQTKTLSLVFALCILGSLINPNHIKGLIYPFHVLTNYGYEVIENLNFFQAIHKGYADITFAYFIAGVLVLWVGVFTFYKKISRLDILVGAYFTLLAFFAVRNFPLFALGTFIVMTRIVIIALKSSVISKNKHLKETIVLVVILISIPGVYLNFKLHGVGFGVIDEANSAVNFLIKNKISGPIFNNYNIGNYLEYRLYPKERIFVDGNPEQYPSKFFKEVYYPMESSYPSFVRLSNKYKINAIFYEHKNQTQMTNPVLTSLSKDPNWKIIYLDSRIIIFLNNNPQNKLAIQENEITEKNVNIKNLNEYSKDKIGDLSNLFRILEWYRPMLDMDLKYLEFEPENCTALRHVAVLKLKFKEPDYNKYITLFNKNCN